LCHFLLSSAAAVVIFVSIILSTFQRADDACQISKQESALAAEGNRRKVPFLRRSFTIQNSSLSSYRITSLQLACKYIRVILACKLKRGNTVQAPLKSAQLQNTSQIRFTIDAGPFFHSAATRWVIRCSFPCPNS